GSSYSVKGVDGLPVTAYLVYTPKGAEGLVNSVPHKMRPFAERLNGQKITYVVPDYLFSKRDDVKAMESFLLQHLGIKATIKTLDASENFSSLQYRGLDLDSADERIVLLGTEDDFKNADAADAFQKKLLEKAVKMPALPNREKLSKKDKEVYKFFATEMLAAGSALAGVVSSVDNNGLVDRQDMTHLTNLLEQFIQVEQSYDITSFIYCLLPYDENRDMSLLPANVNNTIASIAKFIQNILMKRPIEILTEKLQERFATQRRIAWSA
ncbi:MAG: hypothetical protein PHQ52_06805, partial [Candidatus Omnitrophica bacterium]|nr:hypothetical protein [Candidatus Omnitrophota bacterium]